MAAANHKLFAQILAHAIACDQTRVMNISFSDGASSLRKGGEPTTQHIHTHEDPIDDKLGYQPGAAWFENQIMTSFGVLLETLQNVREGDGTLLDRTVVMALSECGYAKQHTLESIPIFLAGGKDNGKIQAPASTSPRRANRPAASALPFSNVSACRSMPGASAPCGPPGR